MPAAISGTKGSADRPMRQVRPEALRQLMERLLVACGATEEIAPVQADMHLEADLRGMDIQGLDHMFTLIEDIRAGHIDPAASPEVTQDLGATVLIDGHAGLGVPAAMLGIDVAVERARKHGSCVVGITNSSDVFMLGYYGDKLAREGLVAILATNSPPHTHAVGGSEAVIGTNPFVIAIPTPGPNPLVLDFATSHWAGSYFRQAAYHGEQLPEGLAFDPDGVPTRDPQGGLSPRRHRPSRRAQGLWLVPLPRHLDRPPRRHPHGQRLERRLEPRTLVHRHRPESLRGSVSFPCRNSGAYR